MQVTIDVRAPVRGTVRAITVKEEDTVTVGQVVAVLDESDSATAQPSAAAQQDSVQSQAPVQPPQPQAQSQDMDELRDAANRISDSAMRGQKAHIAFPPRKTETGMTISFMPAVDQEKYKARGMAAKSKESGQAAPQEKQPQEGAAQAQTSPERTYMPRQIPRMQLTEAEMEAINLGGAPP